MLLVSHTSPYVSADLFTVLPAEFGLTKPPHPHVARDVFGGYSDLQSRKLTVALRPDFAGPTRGEFIALRTVASLGPNVERRGTKPCPSQPFPASALKSHTSVA